MEIIQKETTGNNSFIDIFSGTATVAKQATETYKTVVINDILFSNYIIYTAFFHPQKWDSQKLIDIANGYNTLKADEIKENYFSKNFGGKFYEKDLSKIIGYIRQDVEYRKIKLFFSFLFHLYLFFLQWF